MAALVAHAGMQHQVMKSPDQAVSMPKRHALHLATPWTPQALAYDEDLAPLPSPRVLCVDLGRLGPWQAPRGSEGLLEL